MSTVSTLQLYRQIIKAAKLFPSIKRHKLLQDIRLGFRENKELTGAKVAEHLSIARKGLQQLSQYSLLPRNKGSWAVTMETDPMPKPKNELPSQ